MSHYSEFHRPGFLAWLAQTMRDRRARAKQRREFENLAACGVLDDVLADAGLSRADIPTVIGAHPQSARRFGAMRHWTGAGAQPLPPVEELRDAQLRCVHCTVSKQCERWLALPPGERPVPTFCPNIGIFRRIRAWQAGHSY